MSNKEKIFWSSLILILLIIVFWVANQSEKEKIEKEIERKEYLKNNKDLILEEEKKYPIQSRDHIKPGEKVEKYTTNPPTSGPHENAEKGGFYPDGLPDEKAIHNLEHGYIWLSYKNISDDDIKKLEELSKKYLGSVIISKREKNDFNGIALVSWGNLMKIKNFDLVIIEDFIKRNKNKSPEKLAI